MYSLEYKLHIIAMIESCSEGTNKKISQIAKETDLLVGRIQKILLISNFINVYYFNLRTKHRE